MNTSLRVAAIGAALCITLSPLHAATEQECLSLWKTADIDANGALSKSEDSAGYLAIAQKAGKPLQSDTLSRADFLQLCADNAFAAAGAATSPSPAAGRDLGKGDLTPARNPLSEADARSKIEASGFREIQGLKLGDDSIWRGSAVVNGERQSIAIDAQGDIVAKSDGPKSEMAQSEAPPPKPAPQAKAEPKASPVSTQVEGVERGSAGPGGLMLWTFLLIGNALALVMLSWMTAGGTSAMSPRPGATTFR